MILMKSTSTLLSLQITNTYAKKKGITRKLILTLRATMISQEVDLVAGDYNGTAWRCRSRENLSTVDEAFDDCALPMPLGSTIVEDPDPSRTLGQTCAVSSSHPTLNVFLESK